MSASGSRYSKSSGFRIISMIYSVRYQHAPACLLGYQYEINEDRKCNFVI